MSGFLYILQSQKNRRYYIGSTNDLARRIDQHRTSQVKATRYILPIDLVFTQEYPTIEEARQIEYKLKSFKNRKIIEQIIKDGRIKITGR
jgi:putative endonuclease